MQIIIRLLFVALLSSCAATNKKPAPSAKDEFHDLMSNKISELNNYARTHSAISYHENQENKFNNVIGDYDEFPKILNVLADVKYYGSVKTLLESLAKSFDFEFTSNGVVPTRPIDVYIDDKNTRLVDILFHIGSQLADDTILSVNINRSTDNFNIILKYKNR